MLHDSVAKRRSLKALAAELSAIAFLVPFLVPFLVFYVWPVVKGGWMSLHVWGVAGKQRFVGLDNYAKILRDDNFYANLWHSFYFVLIFVPLVIVFGLVLALLVNRKMPMRALFRSVYFLPYVLSVSIVCFIWMRMLDSGSGLVNAILAAFGLPGANWLTDPDWAWWSIAITTVWWTVGFVMVLFLAGLQEIPVEFYEAANIDGANSYQRFRHITLPGLSGVMRVQIFYQVIASLKLFGQVHIMTQGGPGDTTNTFVRYIYLTGFKKDLFGLASAQSLLFCLIMLIITAAQYRFMNKRED